MVRLQIHGTYAQKCYNELAQCVKNGYTSGIIRWFKIGKLTVSRHYTKGGIKNSKIIDGSYKFGYSHILYF